MQVYWIKQAFFDEIEDHETDCFAQLPAYLQCMTDTDNETLSWLSYDENTDEFEAVIFASFITRNVCQRIHTFVTLNTCHTKSKYLMMFMIAVRINANDNVISLS